MQSISDNHKESAKMYAEFAKVAEGNEYAWSFGAKAETEESIGTVGRRNRMICLPCELRFIEKCVLERTRLTVTDPLLMNAFNTINLAGAVILTSTDHARKLGIPLEKWIYPLGGAGTRDSDDCRMRTLHRPDPSANISCVVWQRPEFWWSPSISKSIDAGLAVSGLDKEDIDLYDFYS